MAYFPPANGDSQQVYALDTNNGALKGALTSTAALVQMAGPKLDYFKIIVQDGSNSAVDLRGEVGVTTAGVFYPGVVNQLTQAIQQTATIAMYQIEADTSGQISIGVYPQAAWTAATLDAALKALGNVQVTSSNGTVTGVDVSGTDVTTAGFKLA